MTTSMLSKNFKRSDFACNCGCGFDKIDLVLVAKLQKIVDHFNFVSENVKIDSGCRCEKHNIAVGGKQNSLHLVGKAADIRFIGIPAIMIFKFADAFIGNSGGVGNYPQFTHIDVRGSYARW